MKLNNELLWSRILSHAIAADSTRILLETMIAQQNPSLPDSLRAAAHHHLGKHFSLTMDAQQAIPHFQRAKQLYVSLQLWEQTGYSLIQLGNCYLQTNLLDSAMMAYQQANQLCLDHQLHNNTWTSYIGLAHVHQKANQVSTAFSFAEKAIAATRASSDRASKVIALNLIIRMAHEYDSTALLVRYSDELFRLYSPIELDQETMTHFNYFMHVRDPVARIRLLQGAIASLTAFPPGLELISSYDQLAKAYRETGNYAAAIAAWQQALTIERDTLQIVHFTPYLLRSLHEAYLQEGEYQKALTAYQRYTAVKDSLLQGYNQSRMDELRFEYETREKDAALAGQQFMLSRRTTQRNWIIAISVFLILTGMYALYVQRRHLYDQRTIAAQQEKLHTVQIAELTRQHEIKNLQTLINAQEEERRRIALDLHDSLGGLLASMKLQARKIADLDRTGPLTATVKDHMQLIDFVSTETRRIAHNMMPPALVRMGLTIAIEDLVRAIHLEKSLEVTFQNIDYDRSLRQEQEITLYRIIQELCTNVIRHAGARHLLIQLSRHNGSATLVVEDDGRGFDTTSQAHSGLGLESIRSRVAYLEGDMEFWSLPGQGTSITINIPVS